MKKTKGSLFLLLAALIWGVAFVAQTSATEQVAPFTFNAVRCLVGSVFLVILIFFKSRIGKKNQAPSQKKSKRRIWLGGILCGVMIFLAVNLQQFGIDSYPEGVAVAGRSGFLTASYVVIVAMASGIMGRKMHPLILLAAVGCMAGMYFLCLSDGLDALYLGDALMILCAIAFTIHIFVIDRFREEDSMVLSCIQFFVCGILSMIGMLLFEKPNLADIFAAWLPILYTGILSSGVAYTLQMIGQKHAEPAVASIVMSLESVFSALAGWVILSEQLSGVEALGCALVFASVILAQLPSFFKEKGEQHENAPLN